MSMNRQRRDRYRTSRSYLMCLLLVAAGGMATSVRAAPLAIVCEAPSVPGNPNTCARGFYTAHPAADALVRVGTSWTDFALSQFAQVPDTATIDACTNADGAVPEGSAVPVPWSSGADPCKAWAAVPASTFRTLSTGVPAVLSVTWTLPTMGTSNGVDVPLTADNVLTGVQLFVSTSPVPDDYAGNPTATFSGEMVQATYNGSVPDGVTIYVRVRAINQYAAGPMSAQVSKLISLPKPQATPGAVTDVQIQLTIQRKP